MGPYCRPIMADKVGRLTARHATTPALLHRERTGESQEVEVAILATMASSMLVEMLVQHADGAMFDPPVGAAVYGPLAELGLLAANAEPV